MRYDNCPLAMIAAIANVDRLSAAYGISTGHRLIEEVKHFMSLSFMNMRKRFRHPAGAAGCRIKIFHWPGNQHVLYW